MGGTKHERIGSSPKNRARGHLVYAATLARAQQKLIQPADTIQRLRLRTDFGRIAQKFPVNSSYLVKQEAVLEDLILFAHSLPISIVIGEPGAGKSWLLTQLTDRWNQDGTAAIRHYCYLEPTDREVQRRVTTGVMFGNLTAELLEVRPSLKPGTAPLFAATARTFESLLHELSAEDELYVVVDGIDHISRVAHQSTSLAAEDVDIVDQIALLKLPPNVHLIIGSQPGPHLQPLLSHENVFQVPAWQTEDVEILIEKIGLSEILLNSGHGGQIAEVIKQIDLRSEGNPLYATYITREVRSRVEQGEAILLADLIDQIPFRLSDLRNYYDYLFDRISHHQAVSVVESLALLDFGVSRADLAEIYPADAHRLSQALAILRPILERASAQGGFRIYHESFRRFVVDKLITAGASVSSRLQPVCEWLERRGFFKDSKAYRFLIPTLRRAGRDKEVLDRVAPSFMQDSLHEGHPSIAIAYNLVVAAEVAANRQDWGMLARINEIQRANATYVSERIGDVAMYGMAFAELRGAETLSERLLFEDRQTFAHEPGLLLCEVCDRAGVVPPWREYMRLPASDLGNSFSQSQVTLAFFRGIARVHGREEAIGLLIEWSDTIPDRTDLLYGAIERLESVFGEDVLDVLLSLRVSSTLRVAVLSAALRRARAIKGQSRFDGYAQELLAIAPDLATRAQVVKLGAFPSSLEPVPAPATYVLDDIYAPQYQSNLTDWMAALAIAARI
ncbi:MAG: NACHT domain-containing protein [Terracidiphilus sp.]